MTINWTERCRAYLAETRQAPTPKTPETPLSGVLGAPTRHLFGKTRPSLVGDPATDCWPYGPSLNAGEIATMERRIYLFKRHRVGLVEAERLADRLVLRDREVDDRVMCLECAHGRSQRCPNGQPLPYGVLQRCNRFVETTP